MSVEDEILKELLTILEEYGYGCGSKLEKCRLLWSCPKCGEMGEPIPDDRL